MAKYDAVVIGLGIMGSAALLALARRGARVVGIERYQPGHELGSSHGRLLMVEPSIADAHTGHGIVMPQCHHGGPGRAGNGEELGGLNGLRLYHQRVAVQGSTVNGSPPDTPPVAFVQAGRAAIGIWRRQI